MSAVSQKQEPHNRHAGHPFSCSVIVNILPCISALLAPICLAIWWWQASLFWPDANQWFSWHCTGGLRANHLVWVHRWRTTATGMGWTRACSCVRRRAAPARPWAGPCPTSSRHTPPTSSAGTTGKPLVPSPQMVAKVERTRAGMASVTQTPCTLGHPTLFVAFGLILIGAVHKVTYVSSLFPMPMLKETGLMPCSQAQKTGNDTFLMGPSGYGFLHPALMPTDSPTAYRVCDQHRGGCPAAVHDQLRSLGRRRQRPLPQARRSIWSAATVFDTSNS